MMLFFPLVSLRRLCAFAFRVAVAIGTGATAAAEETGAVRVPPFRDIVPFRATIEGAQKAKLVLEGIRPAREGAVLVPDDSVTALVSHVDGEKSRQWLVHFVAKSPTKKEREIRIPDLVMYSTSGREIRFPGEVSAVAIRVMGPYQDMAKGGKDAKDRWSGALVNGPYLALGLDRACRLELRIAALPVEGEGQQRSRFGFRGTPFPAETIAEGRQTAERFGMTAEDERAFAGVSPALTSFFQIISGTPGLDDILRSVVDVSWWGIIKNGGNVVPYIATVEPSSELTAADWGLPADAKCYAFKFRIDLNGRPALVCRMAVTSPRPPLLTSAGIVGLAALRPDGKGPHLMIRVIDARTGTESAAGPR